MVDARLRPSQRKRESPAVDASRPRQVAGAVVLLRPLRLEECLGLPVTLLLLPVRTQRVASVVPDHGRRAERKRPSTLAQAPADVYVVASGAKLRVESFDGLKCRLLKRHVAARDVLRFCVGDEDLHRSARRVCDAIGDRTVSRRRDVRAADADRCGGCERRREVSQPVRIRPRVVVGVRHNLAGGCMEAGITGAAQPSVLGLDQVSVELQRDRCCRVGRTIINNNHLVVGVFER